MDREIEYYKSLGRDGPIPLDALKALKQLGDAFDKPVDAPEPFKTVLETWNKFRMFAIAHIAQEEYPVLTKCWNDIQAKFGKAFVEGDTFLDTWCFFDFPCNDGKPYASWFIDEAKNQQGMFQVASFAEAMMKTRYGLYQLVLAKKDTMKLKELFTNEVFEVHNSLDAYEDGEIFLMRLFPVGDKHMAFGDPYGFPKEWKERLTDMVIDKAFTYYMTDPSTSEAELYSKHMKYSGPYWMSVVSPDKDSDILDPDYYMKYLE